MAALDLDERGRRARTARRHHSVVIAAAAALAFIRRLGLCAEGGDDNLDAKRAGRSGRWQARPASPVRPGSLRTVLAIPAAVAGSTAALVLEVAQELQKLRLPRNATSRMCRIIKL